MTKKFFPGDIVRFIGRPDKPDYARNCLFKGDEREVAFQQSAGAVYAGFVVVTGRYRNGEKPMSGLRPECFELVSRAAGNGAARETDPATSKAAAKPKRIGLRARIDQLFCLGYRATGHEVAEALSAKLNSVTPRFAELTKAGVLVDSGERRDGQIVWKRA